MKTNLYVTNPKARSIMAECLLSARKSARKLGDKKVSPYFVWGYLRGALNSAHNEIDSLRKTK